MAKDFQVAFEPLRHFSTIGKSIEVIGVVMKSLTPRGYLHSSEQQVEAQ